MESVPLMQGFVGSLTLFFLKGEVFCKGFYWEQLMYLIVKGDFVNESVMYCIVCFVNVCLVCFKLKRCCCDL